MSIEVSSTSTKVSKKRKVKIDTADSAAAELPAKPLGVEDSAIALHNEPDADVVDADDTEDVEVEAISHAEQRKRRKLEKKKAKESALAGEEGDDHDTSAAAKPVGTTAAAKTPKVNSDDTARQKRSGFGIWVGNLAFATDADKIKSFFASCGPVTRLHMPKGNGKFHHNKGFAYLDFEDQEALDAAIKLSEGNLDGRRLLIKDSKSYAGRPQGATTAAAAVLNASAEQDGAETSASSSAKKAVASASEHNKTSLSKTARKILDRQRNPPAPTLFIGNLGFETEKEMIQELFERHAESNRAWQSKKGKPKERKKKAKKSEMSSEDESGSDAEEGDSTTGSEADEKDEPPAIKKPTGSAAGIRKVRIGTFEDSGKCKGWAFVDFHLTSQATLSLIDGRNHRLNGRDLKIEYASADAVRRGGGRMDGEAPRQKRGDDIDPARSQKRKREYGEGREESQAEAEIAEAEEPAAPIQGFYRPPLAANPFAEVAKAHKPNKEERAALREEKKKTATRQKPGAALAAAQREKVAIQPAKGTKITFE